MPFQGQFEVIKLPFPSGGKVLGGYCTPLIYFFISQPRNELLSSFSLPYPLPPLSFLSSFSPDHRESGITAADREPGGMRNNSSFFPINRQRAVASCLLEGHYSAACLFICESVYMCVWHACMHVYKLPNVSSLLMVNYTHGTRGSYVLRTHSTT